MENKPSKAEQRRQRKEEKRKRMRQIEIQETNEMIAKLTRVMEPLLAQYPVLDYPPISSLLGSRSRPGAIVPTTQPAVQPLAQLPSQPPVQPLVQPPIIQSIGLSSPLEDGSSSNSGDLNVEAESSHQIAGLNNKLEVCKAEIEREKRRAAELEDQLNNFRKLFAEGSMKLFEHAKFLRELGGDDKNSDEVVFMISGQTFRMDKHAYDQLFKKDEERAFGSVLSGLLKVMGKTRKEVRKTPMKQAIEDYIKRECKLQKYTKQSINLAWSRKDRVTSDTNLHATSSDPNSDTETNP